MTATIVDHPAPPGPEVDGPSGAPRALRRPLVAGPLLLLVYVVLSLFNHPGGYLGTDTGGKIATLEVMAESGRLDPDVGYWAEPWDPEGDLHPLWYTSHIGDRWVNVTTLPALFLAAPLYDLGGYRAALLVPMLGAVAAAFAAREIARRTGRGDGWSAYWLIGLASPMTIYALDFWEHSLGVALMAWGIVAFMALVEPGGLRRGLVLGAAGGLAFGTAATMRTEALVYAAVAAGGTCALLLLRRRSLTPPVFVGGAAVGVLLPLWANSLLERAVLGSAQRTTRAAGTVAMASDDNGSRLSEAALTSFSLRPVMSGGSFLLGAIVLALLVFVVRRAASPTGDQGPAVLAGLAVVGLYLLRASEGAGFVPGLIAATPLAAVGLALGWRARAARLPIAIVLLALPVVWALQYTGGAAPQWAGRYILTTGLVLAAVGAGSLRHVRRWAQVGLIGLSVGVTCIGLVWLAERSHDVGRAGELFGDRPEAVLITDIAHLPRELGVHHLDQRWLTATNGEDRAAAADVVRRAGFDSFGFVRLGTDVEPPSFDGFRLTGEDEVPYISVLELQILTYERAGARGG